MATTSQWIAGARPRTLPAAFAPVFVGAGLGAVSVGQADLHAGMISRVLLALVVALALQVGVNYANDYSDGIRGTDDVRVGPLRLTGSKLATPAAVKRAAFISFGIAGLGGVGLTILTGAWWLLAMGAVCILAAWWYTGGKHPYGYLGLGELFVFVFFGLVAVMGTTFTMIGSVPASAVFGAIGVGLLTVAILLTNNLRDIPTDKDAGKITLAVRLGDSVTRKAYVSITALAFVCVLIMAATATWWILLALAAAVMALKPVQTVLGGATGRELIPVLAGTGKLVLVYGVLVLVGSLIGVFA